MSVLMPLARTNDLVIQEHDNEFLIYDLINNKAFCLNVVSSEIWKGCDGTSSAEEVALKVGKLMNIKLDADFIWLAISDLEKHRLLQSKVDKPVEFENLSRRKVLLKYAFPTLILPLVTSIIAPIAAHAASGTPPTACPSCPTSAGLPRGCPCSPTACSNCAGSVCQSNNMCG